MDCTNISLVTIESGTFSKNDILKKCRVCLEQHKMLTNLSEKVIKIYQHITSIEVVYFLSVLNMNIIV